MHGNSNIKYVCIHIESASAMHEIIFGQKYT